LIITQPGAESLCIIPRIQDGVNHKELIPNQDKKMKLSMGCTFGTKTNKHSNQLVRKHHEVVVL
jgi:hypothetical protein